MILTEFYLNCDECGVCFNPEERGGFSTKTTIRQRAEKYGWCRVRENMKHIDLCPTCVKSRVSDD